MNNQQQEFYNTHIFEIATRDERIKKLEKLISVLKEKESVAGIISDFEDRNGIAFSNEDEKLKKANESISDLEIVIESQSSRIQELEQELSTVTDLKRELELKGNRIQELENTIMNVRSATPKNELKKPDDAFISPPDSRRGSVGVAAKDEIRRGSSNSQGSSSSSRVYELLERLRY